MNHSNAKKAQQLGMPLGTACGRLRKLILFDLLCQLKKNVCFQCEEPIVAAADLSIEHKEPWLGKDTKLFWDLDNIAFSHLHCNCSARRGSGDKRTNKAGNILCARCRQWKPPSAFTKSRAELCGYYTYCRSCRKEWNNWGHTGRTNPQDSSMAG